MFILSYFLLFSARNTVALKKFNESNLQDKSFQFQLDAFKFLTKVPTSHFCIWSQQQGPNDVLDRLVVALIFNKKSLSNLNFEGRYEPLQKCLHNIILLQNQKTCTGILKTSVQLSAMHFFYLLVDGEWKRGAKGLLPCSEQFGHARVVFVFLRDRRVFSLSSSLFPPRHFEESQLTDILHPPSLVVNNLLGRRVDVATFNCSPYVLFNKDDSEEIDGVEGILMKEISNILNFTINVVELKGSKGYGIVQNGTWEGGVLGALKLQEAEIGMCNIFQDALNFVTMDFGPYNNVVSYTFLVPRPRLVIGNWKSLVNVFKTSVWLSAFGCYCVITFCYWLICNTSSSKDSIGPSESMLTMFGMLTLTSWHAKSRARRLVTWWLLFVLLLTATYSSSIAARLTSPHYEARIDSIKQLVQSNFHWGTDSISMNYARVVMNMADVWQKKFIERYKVLPPHKVLEAVRSRKFAILVQRWGHSMLIFKVNGLDYEHDLTAMRVLKERTIDRLFSNFVFAKKTPISYTMQIALLRLRQMGLINLWCGNAERRLTPSFAKSLQEEHDITTMANPRPLLLVNLMSAFYILAFGLLFSALVLLLEISYFRFVNNSKARVNKN